MLSNRTGEILKSIVGQYIVDTVPVPSQSIASKSALGVSSATIRNEMAQLEQEGYIIRSHPSAGSIPSDKGYRYYVETLDEVRLSSTEQRLVNHVFHQVEREIDKWVSLAATLIAQLAQNVAVVTVPKPASSKFKYLELVALQDTLALVVLVLMGAKVKQKLITFDQAVTQAELMVIANKLNSAYAGLTSRQISAKKMVLSPVEEQITEQVLKIIEAEDEREYEEPYLDGLHFTLTQPEFAHSQQMLSLMELVEQRNLLKAITPEGLESRRVEVIIGQENKAEAFRNYSVVISNYGIPEEAVGTLAVVGPTRMPYAHTISAVGYLSAVLSGLVSGLYGRRTSTGAAEPETD